MLIYTSAKRWYEQYLNGDCADISKLKLQFLDSRDRSFLRVHTVESVSDGTLRILVDTSVENSYAKQTAGQQADSSASPSSAAAPAVVES